MTEAMPQLADPSPRRGRARGRSPLFFGLFVVSFTAGSIVAALALTAALSGLGLWGGLLVGLLVAVGLPLFLTLRLGTALKARGLAAPLRYITLLLLAAATHLMLLGVSTEWAGRSSSDVFAAASALLERTAGDLPVVSGILQRGAEEASVDFGGDKAAAAAGPDGGPTGADGGLAEADGGAARAPRAAGDAGAAADEGVLSSRTSAGRPVGAVGATARTEAGGYAGVVVSLDAGGAVRQRVLDLSPFADEGGPTAAAANREGEGVFVLGGGKAVRAPLQGGAVALPALSRGGTLKGGGTLRSLHDVVIAPGGAILAVGEVIMQGETRAALLAWAPGGAAASIVRKEGDAVLEAPKGSRVLGFFLLGAGPAGRVTLVETFAEGGATGGAPPPERLLVGRVDEPSFLDEVARTGDAVAGRDDRSFASFRGAGVLADGRVLFDGSFAEQREQGGLFVARPGQPPGAAAARELADDLVARGQAAWGSKAPRARHLAVEPDGRFAFVRQQGGLALVELDRVQSPTLLEDVTAYRRDDGALSAAGPVHALERPALGQGGDWLIFTGTLDGQRRALLLSSRADVEEGAAEVLLEEGGALPGGGGTVRSLVLHDRPIDTLSER